MLRSPHNSLLIVTKNIWRPLTKLVFLVLCLTKVIKGLQNVYLNKSSMINVLAAQLANIKG